MTDELIKVQCATCGRPTSHIIKAAQLSEGHDDDYGWSFSYQIIQCRGCDSISFRVTGNDSNDPEDQEMLYPSRTQDHKPTRQPIIDSLSLPEKIGRIYDEVLQALDHQAPILASIGLRILVEAVCLDLDCTGKTLVNKIKKLADPDMGLLSTKQAEILQTHRSMGNAAAHEILAPKPYELTLALDIVETLLKTLYVLPGMAEMIKTGKELPGNS